MKLVVNGDEREVVGEPTVATIAGELGQDGSGRGVAVAVNGEVVPRSEWSSTPLSEQDRVEVLRAVGGG